MFPPDWTADNVIAAIAIVASAVVAILTTAANLVYNYITTRQNIKARRVEIAAEKSIEAYREIIEKMVAFNWAIQEGEGSENSRKAYAECEFAFKKYKYYLPKELYEDLLEFFIIITIIVGMRDLMILLNAFKNMVEWKPKKDLGGKILLSAGLSSAGLSSAGLSGSKSPFSQPPQDIDRGGLFMRL